MLKTTEQLKAVTTDAQRQEIFDRVFYESDVVATIRGNYVDIQVDSYTQITFLIDRLVSAKYLEQREFEYIPEDLTSGFFGPITEEQYALITGEENEVRTD